MMPDDQLRESQAMYKQAEKMTPRKSSLARSADL